MTSQPLMPKATAVWLVENTALSFDQIAEFCKLHPLEVKAIADGDAAQGIKGLDPVLTGQLSREDIEAAEADPGRRLKLADPKVRLPETKSKKKGPRYTPVSRRQDRPNAILWLIRNHPELKDSQIMRLVGTTKSTIQAIRERTHWNASNLQPMDPVTLGLCSQIDLDLEVHRAAKDRPAEVDAFTTLVTPSTLAEPPTKLLSMDGGMVNIFGEGWKELKVGLVADIPAVSATAEDGQVHLTGLQNRAVVGDVGGFAAVLWALTVFKPSPMPGWWSSRRTVPPGFGACVPGKWWIGFMPSSIWHWPLKPVFPTTRLSPSAALQRRNSPYPSAV